MKKLVLLVAIFALTACGVAQAEYDHLREQHESLSLNLEETFGLLQSTQSYLSFANEVIDELEERNNYLEPEFPEF